MKYLHISADSVYTYIFSDAKHTHTYCMCLYLLSCSVHVPIACMMVALLSEKFLSFLSQRKLYANNNMCTETVVDVQGLRILSIRWSRFENFVVTNISM